MREALGLVETKGLSNAILVADVMVKTANVNIVSLENTRGSGYMTIKISGDVGAVNAAVTCGKKIAIENNSLVAAKVIPRPSSSIEVTFCQLNNKSENISKENIINEDNNQENSVKTDDVMKENSLEEDKESSDNVINREENLEDKTKQTIVITEKNEVDESLAKAEDKSHKKREIESSSNSSKAKDSNTEKSKTRRTRKKAEPKKKEE